MTVDVFFLFVYQPFLLYICVCEWLGEVLDFLCQILIHQFLFITLLWEVGKKISTYEVPSWYIILTIILFFTFFVCLFLNCTDCMLEFEIRMAVVLLSSCFFFYFFNFSCFWLGDLEDSFLFSSSILCILVFGFCVFITMVGRNYILSSLPLFAENEEFLRSHEIIFDSNPRPPGQQSRALPERLSTCLKFWFAMPTDLYLWIWSSVFLRLKTVLFG